MRFAANLYCLLGMAAGCLSPVQGQDRARFPDFVHILEARRLLACPYEKQWDVVQAGWKEDSDGESRAALLAVVNSPQLPENEDDPSDLGIHPRLLDVLDLGVGDNDPKVRDFALRIAAFHTGRATMDTATYKAWRKSEGSRALPDVVRHACSEAVSRLNAASEPEAAAILPTLGLMAGPTNLEIGRERLLWQSRGERIDALRREALIKAGVLERVSLLLHSATSSELQVALLEFVAYFHPDPGFSLRVEADVHRLLARRLTADIGREPRIILALAPYAAPWADDLLLALFRSHYTPETRAWLMFAVESHSDARLIPALIGRMEDRGHDLWVQQMQETKLRELTREPGSALAGVIWWRAWWRAHRGQYPPAVRAIPLANDSRYPPAIVIPREAVRVTARGTAYVRISSGLLITGNASNTVTAADGTRDIADREKPGLLVVALDDGADMEQAKSFWMQMDQSVLHGCYYIALVAPDFGGAGALPSGKEAASSTEAIAARVSAAAKDALATLPVNPAKVYLIGVGASGGAVGRCAALPVSAFHGFLCLNAPLRVSALPSTAALRGTRFVLLRDTSDRTVPEFLAVSARTLLQRAGAIVKRMDYTPAPGIDPSSTLSAAILPDQIGAAILWLESGR